MTFEFSANALEDRRAIVQPKAEVITAGVSVREAQELSVHDSFHRGPVH